MPWDYVVAGFNASQPRHWVYSGCVCFARWRAGLMPCWKDMAYELSSSSLILISAKAGYSTSDFSVPDMNVSSFLRTSEIAKLSIHALDPLSKVSTMSLLQSFSLLILFLASTVQPTFDHGVFSIETISVPGLTADSATTLILTGPSTTQTSLVPIWHCTTNCANDYYGILVIPPIVTGIPGNVYPPPGYLVC